MKPLIPSWVKYVAYSCNEFSRKVSFTYHRTNHAAEVRHGNLGSLYRGSCYLDYYLNVCTVDEFLRMAVEIGLNNFDFEKQEFIQ